MIHRSLSFHVNEQWEVVPGACSKVCLSSSAVFRGGQGAKLGEKHKELGAVPTWPSAGGTGAKDTRMFWGSVPLCSRVTSAVLCEGRAVP